MREQHLIAFLVAAVWCGPHKLVPRHNLIRRRRANGGSLVLCAHKHIDTHITHFCAHAITIERATQTSYIHTIRIYEYIYIDTH